MPDTNPNRVYWGGDEIAPKLNLTRRQLYHKLPELQKLGVVEKINGVLFSSDRRIEKLVTGELTPST